jgi:hypothetical protein
MRGISITGTDFGTVENRLDGLFGTVDDAAADFVLKTANANDVT